MGEELAAQCGTVLLDEDGHGGRTSGITDKIQKQHTQSLLELWESQFRANTKRLPNPNFTALAQLVRLW